MRGIDRVGLALVTGALALGCSALIEPDPSRLGGDGGGQPGMDAGRGDAGRDDAGRDDAGRVRDGGDPPIDSGEDGGPVCPASCDDEVACTTDACEAGRCTHAPNDASCGDRERCSPTLGCVPERCTRDEECDDGLFCNGEERCDAGAPGTGCVSGVAPACTDGASCTADRCDEDADRCAHDPDHAACADLIDCTVDACDPSTGAGPSGCVHRADDSLCASDFCTVERTCSVTGGCSAGRMRDCRDGDPCTSDACDSVAGACSNPPRDDDGDGAAVATIPSGSGVIVCGGTDCNDSNPAIHPGATEVCSDAVDNDCDGMINEGCTTIPDDCSSEATIDLRTVATRTETGAFSTFRHDYQTNAICGAGSNGRDAVYAVVLPRGVFDVTIDTIGSAADTVLAVALDCNATAFQGACNDDYGPSSASTASRIWIHRGGSSFTETTFYVLVDAYSSTATGSFQLNVQRTAARADRCPSTTSGLAFDITGGGTLVGFQTEFASSTRGSCQPSWDTDPEAVLHFRAASGGAADFRVYSADFVPDVYLRERPCSSGTELECVNGSSLGGGINGATLRETGLTSGESYFLFVDGGRTSYAVYYEPY